MEEEAPSTSASNQGVFLSGNRCVICNGAKGYLSSKEKAQKLTQKGLETLLSACEDRQDEVANKILPLRGTPELDDLHFHNSCRSSYTCLKKRELAKKRRQEDAPCSTQPKVSKRLSRDFTSAFSWDDDCFICGKPENKKTGMKLSAVNMRPDEVRERVLQGAIATGNNVLVQRLTFEKDLFAKNAKYHRQCYQKISCQRNVQAKKRKVEKEKVESIQNKAAGFVYDHFQERLDNQVPIHLKEMVNYYRECLIQLEVEPEVAKSTRSFYVKKKMMENYGSRMSFYSQHGKPDVACSSDITMGDLVRKIGEMTDSEEEGEIVEEYEEQDDTHAILHRAVGILRKDIEKLPTTTEYPNVNEVDIESSAAFLPESLQKVLQWLLDKNAFDSADQEYKSSNETRRRYTTLAECIVYCSRRGKNQVIPPFHVGFMAQLHHEYGSRSLIDTLHAYGICASYDELRRFQTASAEEQISRSVRQVYMPPGILPITAGGALIQEGDDNIDINVETVDGKNTYHSMGRVVFQEQKSDVESVDSTTKLQRIDRRSLECKDKSILKPLPFNKPTSRPEPKRIRNIAKTMSQEADRFEMFHVSKDLTWALLRQVPRGNLPIPKGVHSVHTQIVPFWTGFNAQTSQYDSKSVTVASYLPIIEASPSDMATVYTTLKKGKDLAEKCGQDSHVHTFDQQLYAIAQMVKHSRMQEFPNLVIRLGGFHNLSTFIASIGKLWGDAGLKDMLADSDTYAPNTVESMLAGKQFHRATRGLTLVYEALVQIFMSNFLKWLEDNDRQETMTEVVNHLCDVQKAFLEYDRVSAQTIDALTSKIEEKLVPVLNEFLGWGKQSVTFTFWADFMKAMQILLANIRAEREGNWQLHLQTQVNMLPYFFVADRQNYARWGSLYATEMHSSLPDTVQEAFLKGEFSVKQTPGKFKGIWSDMGVETTIIKDTKSESGIIGLTRRGTAVLRWTCTRHLLGQYARAMSVRSGTEQTAGERHEQSQPSMMTRDEGHVNQILTHIENNMTDPFDVKSHPELLVNLGTGLVATSEVSSSLANAVAKGQAMMNCFVQSCLDEETEGSKSKSFYAPIPKSGLKTFKDLAKQCKVKIGSKSHRLTVSPELIYQRALTLAKVRPEISLAAVLSYPITVVPPCLFKEDGSKRMTCKADLLHCLENTVKESVTQLPATDDDTAYIIDGMAEFQSLNIHHMKTFQDVADSFLRKIAKLLETEQEVHVVFDRYDDDTCPKGEERSRRQGKGSGHIYQVEGGRPLPDWKSFMGVSANKSQLTSYVSNYLEEAIVADSTFFKTPSQRVYLAGGYSAAVMTKRVSSTGVTVVEELSSTHTEADTRILLHLVDFDQRINDQNRTGRVVVKSPDTDVIVLLLHYMPKMKTVHEVWMATGRVTRTLDQRRMIPVHLIADALGSTVCEVLPAVHSLTGCDTVSSFFGIGKKTAFLLLQKLPVEVVNHLKALGADDEFGAVDAARHFVALLYDPKSKFKATHNSLNNLRVRLAATRTLPIAKLPPCEDVFKMHVKRARWQTMTWTSAHKAKPEIPAPVGNGWKMLDSTVVPVYFEGPTALDKMEDLFCGCIGAVRCSSNTTCPCHRDDLACSEVCRCLGDELCRNPNNPGNTMDHPSDGLG